MDMDNIQLSKLQVGTVAQVAHAVTGSAPRFTCLNLSRRTIRFEQSVSINNLPIELLSIIFDFAMEDVDLPKVTRRDVPLSLTMVCYSWRAVAFSLPSLWASIDADLPNSILTLNFASEWLARSEPAAIRQLSFSFSKQPFDLCKDVLNICVYPYLGNITCLGLSMSSILFRDLSKHLDTSALQVLEAISFTAHGEPVDGLGASFGNSIDLSKCPALSVVSLISEQSTEFISRHCVTGFQWESLTQLDLCDRTLDPITVLDILALCLYLQHCKLLLRGFGPDAPFIPSAQMITMWDLVSWEVEFTGTRNPRTGQYIPTTIAPFFGVFGLPSLEELTIESREVDPGLFTALTRVAARSFLNEGDTFPLHTLHLKGVHILYPHTLVTFLRQTPNLVNLTMVNARGPVDTYQCFFMSFTWKRGMSRHHKVSQCLPLLEHLTVIDNADRVSPKTRIRNELWVLDFLQSRRWRPDWPGRISPCHCTKDMKCEGNHFRTRNNPHTKKMKLTQLQSISIRWRGAPGKFLPPSQSFCKSLPQLQSRGLEVCHPPLLVRAKASRGDWIGKQREFPLEWSIFGPDMSALFYVDFSREATKESDAESDDDGYETEDPPTPPREYTSPLQNDV
ncbi:hypothetical protein H0H81_011415 [Sphagnurus paluster]|uniref:F-box domain-containing protein n=1 Tax=Sphagnurus paluster TaxID=117069 RepID=A0A9P7FNV4_9AGAR|nr:hypothetical protein H0H81_011415 [Sphagnurus paluster]